MNNPSSISSDDPGMVALWQSYRGDVEDLANLVASEHPLHPMVRKEIAAILRGEHEKLKAPQIKRGRGAPKTRTKEDEQQDRKIADLVTRRAIEEERKPKGQRLLRKVLYREVAKQVTAGGYRCSGSYVEKAVERVRERDEKLRDFMRRRGALT